MRAKSAAVSNSFLILTAILAFGVGSPSGSSGQEPKTSGEKNRALTLDEKYERLTGGIFKLREADVTALFGPPQTMIRPGKHDKSDIEMRWQYTTRIAVTYKNGKVTDVRGTFSEPLPVEQVTPDNFRKLQVGMSESEVVEILGDKYASVTVDGVVTGEWGVTAEFEFAFAKDGRVIHHGRSVAGYGPREP